MAKKPKIHELREAFFASQAGAFLLYHEQERSFYRYHDGLYSIISPLEFDRIVDEFLSTTFPDAIDNTSNTIKELIESLRRTKKKSHITLYDATTLSTLTTFNDCIFDFDALTTHPRAPELISFHRIDTDFPPPAPLIPTPAFDTFLATTFTTQTGKPDPELQDFMVSALAFYLMPQNTEPLALILSGSGANGKSIFLGILEMLIGIEFMSALSMEDLSSQFGAVNLLGKRLNLVSEDQSSYINPAKLKAFISQDYVEAQVKYDKNIRFRPRAKHIFSTNQEVRFKDVDKGTMRRFAIVPFYRTFAQPGDPSIDNRLILPQDRDLLYETPHGWRGKLYDERRGILQKLIGRARKIIQNRYVIDIPEAITAMRKEVEQSSSSALDFFHETYAVDFSNNEHISNDLLYDQYKVWYDEEARPPQFLLQSRQFLSALSRNVPGINSDERVMYKGKRTRAKTHLRKLDSLDTLI